MWAWRTSMPEGIARLNRVRSSVSTWGSSATKCGPEVCRGRAAAELQRLCDSMANSITASVAVEIVRFVDARFPGWVEYVLHDALGAKWIFVDKVPVLSAEGLSEASGYPRPATIRC